jgi:hypothetical protein
MLNSVFTKINYQVMFQFSDSFRKDPPDKRTKLARTDNNPKTNEQKVNNSTAVNKVDTKLGSEKGS